jgi:hypothetical protein
MEEWLRFALDHWNGRQLKLYLVIKYFYGFILNVKVVFWKLMKNSTVDSHKLYISLDIYNCLFIYIYIFPGFELRASCLLAGAIRPQLCLQPALFALVILEIGSYVLPRPTWIESLLLYSFHCCWDDRCVPPHLVFSVEMRFHIWSWTKILPSQPP